MKIFDTIFLILWDACAFILILALKMIGILLLLPLFLIMFLLTIFSPIIYLATFAYGLFYIMIWIVVIQNGMFQTQLIDSIFGMTACTILLIILGSCCIYGKEACETIMENLQGIIVLPFKTFFIYNDEEYTEIPPNDSIPEHGADIKTAKRKNKVYRRLWATEWNYELKGSFWDDDERNRKNFKSDNEAEIHQSPEAVAFDIIEKNLTDQYYCFPHVSLREIFRPKGNLQKNKYYLKLLAIFHVDFLLLDKKACLPVAAIEIDGSSHENAKPSKNNDLKEKMFKRAEIPVIHIRLSESDSENFQESIREKLYSELEIKKLYDEPDLNDKNHPIAPVYCPDCAKRMHGRDSDKTGRFFFCAKCTNERSGKNKTIDSRRIAPILKVYFPGTKKGSAL